MEEILLTSCHGKYPIIYNTSQVVSRISSINSIALYNPLHLDVLWVLIFCNFFSMELVFSWWSGRKKSKIVVSKKNTNQIHLRYTCTTNHWVFKNTQKMLQPVGGPSLAPDLDFYHGRLAGFTSPKHGSIWNQGEMFIWAAENRTRWWFQIFFIFTPIWGNDPIWLIFFKQVETTN